MKTEILKRLRETDGYVSGQELCESLGVSRTAVWKCIRQLEDEGYVIEAVRNRGYRLADSGDVLSEQELGRLLSTRWLGKNLVVFDEVDSTNNEARRMAEKGALEGTVILAARQTAGKGRRGRNWESPRGTGIWMSFLLRPEFEPSHASMLTLTAAMAVAQGIRRTTGLDCQIKWPNDIVINGKKLCGILTEMSTEDNQIRYIVVGIGINVNIREFPEEISSTATSLLLESGHPVRRAVLVDQVLRAWEEYYTEFLKTLDFQNLKKEYNACLVNNGRQVQILAPQGVWTGVSLGIDREGQLLVEKPDGSIEPVVSGEVSVRGVYGYV